MTDQNERQDHEDLDIIHLNLEDGSEVKCGIIGIFDAADKEYMALWAMDDEEVLLFNYKEDNDQFELTPIEDEDEFDLVCEAYYELIEEDEEE